MSEAPQTNAAAAAATTPASDVRRVGVIGAGTMGLGIAQVFAQAGFDVLLHDTSAAALDRARQGIEKSLAKFVEKGKLAAADRDATLARLTLADALDALTAVDLAVEAIVEAIDAKRALFAALDRLTPPATLLASNTSSISITRARRRDHARRSRVRPALHEPGAADAAGRARARPGDERRDDGRG